MNITITDKAALEVKKIITEQGEDNLYLRLRVIGGGCAGYQNKLDLDPDVTERDDKYQVNGVDVVIDKRSAVYLDGVTVDFHDEDLNKRGFSVSNPRAKSVCGCGSSFSMG